MNSNSFQSASVLWKLNHAAFCIFGLISSFLTSLQKIKDFCFTKLFKQYFFIKWNITWKSVSVLWKINHTALCMFSFFFSFLMSSGIKSNTYSCFMKLIKLLTYLNKCKIEQEFVSIYQCAVRGQPCSIVHVWPYFQLFNEFRHTWKKSGCCEWNCIVWI